MIQGLRLFARSHEVDFLNTFLLLFDVPSPSTARQDTFPFSKGFSDSRAEGLSGIMVEMEI